MAINNNVGKISQNNVSIKGPSPIETTTSTGSILAVKFIKDNSSAVTNPSNIDSIGLKNWFAQYVGSLGNFNKKADDDLNVSWSNYRDATILGFKVNIKNETYNQYQTNNDAAIIITPFNGNTDHVDGRSFTVRAGGTEQDSTGTSSASPCTFGGFDGQSKVIPISVTDDRTGVTLQMSWTTAYTGGSPLLKGSNTVAGVGRAFNVNWDANKNRSTNYSQDMYFFLGSEATRQYGLTYS